MKIDWGRLKKINKRKCVQIVVLVLFSIIMMWGVKFVFTGSWSAADAYRNFVIAAFILMLALIWFVYFFTNWKQWKIERIYLVCGMVLGSLYLFVLPPAVAPDEMVHIFSSYHVSNVILHTTGEQEEHGIMMQRACDVDLPVSQDLSRENYNNVFEAAFQPAGDTEMVERPATIITPSILYAVSGTGMALGRLLHLSNIGVILLGTWFNVVFFVGFMYYAMKKLPFGKLALFAVCMLPLTLQQTSSCSYDNIIFTAIFLITALSLHFAYSGEKIKKSEIIIYLFASFFLLICKGGVYSLIIFLPFVLLFTKDKLTKKNILIVCGFGILILVILLRNQLLGSLLSSNVGAGAAAAEEIGTYIGWAESRAYSISDFIHDPKSLIILVCNTLVLNIDFYWESMIGSRLGWLRIEIPDIFIFGFILILLIGILKKEGEKGELRTGDKIGALLIVLSAVGGSILGMALSWTPVGSEYIMGVQGRYFLPMLPLFLVILRNNRIVVRKNIDKLAIEGLLLLQTGVIFYLLRSCIGAE